jgi:hypothetical protein
MLCRWLRAAEKRCAWRRRWSRIQNIRWRVPNICWQEPGLECCEVEPMVVPAVNSQKVAKFQGLPGQGVEGEIDGRQLRLGSPAGWASMLIRGAWSAAGRQDGGGAGRWRSDTGLLAIADALRPEFAGAVARLRQRGIRVVMLTGDNAATAAAIAAEAGIDEFRAGILPGDKAAAIGRTEGEWRPWWRWSAMASTMRRRWRQPMSALPSAPVPTPRSRRPI